MSEEMQNGTGQKSKVLRVVNCCSPVIAGPPVDVQAEVKVLAALADPTRLQIVQLLARQDEPLCVCDIVSQFALGQPTSSHHLKVLREARLVTWDKRGLWVYYALNRAALGQISFYLDGLLALPTALSGAPLG
jgi:ArsR family transcriptional regulator